jgi:hypothetical protein
VLPMLLIGLLQRLAFFEETTYRPIWEINWHNIVTMIVKVTKNLEPWCHAHPQTRMSKKIILYTLPKKRAKENKTIMIINSAEINFIYSK